MYFVKFVITDLSKTSAQATATLFGNHYGHYCAAAERAVGPQDTKKVGQEGIYKKVRGTLN